MPRAKTGALPGMERKVNKDIEKLADQYVDARDERMAMLEKEVAAKVKLMSAMKSAGMTSYEFEEDGELIIVDLVMAEETVKVKKRALGDDGD
jgi:hypothetical protein